MKNVLLFGDSNTYGYKPDGTGRFSEKVRWSGLLRNYYRGSDIHFVEEGLCGRTTIFDDVLRPYRRGSDILPVLLETHKPLDLVVIMLGTNDCKTRYKASAEVIARGMELLAEQVESMKGQEKPKILLVSPIQLGTGVGDEEYDPEFDYNSVEVSKALPTAYHKIAQKHGYYFLAASDYASPSQKDREHLDEEGHGLLAVAMREKIGEILRRDYAIT